MAMTSKTAATTKRPPASATKQAAGISLPHQVQHLMVAVEHILRTEPEPLSELELIKKLQAAPWTLLGPVTYNDPSQLFPVHFLLFHSLYRLRDLLAKQGERLSISPLAIRLDTPSVVAGHGLPGETDALRDFYLDLSQYELSDVTIRQMMDDFWTGQWGNQPADAELTGAAETLGLDSIPEHFEPVKQRFRRAVMQAHPDRGGDTQKIQELNEAFALFRSHFQAKKKRRG